MATPESFHYDVFLSHSSKDKAVVRPLAERLRADGVPLESGTFRFRDPLNRESRFPPLRFDDDFTRVSLTED